MAEEQSREGMQPEDFTYAVTRVHMAEKGLLSRQDLEQLIAADSLGDAFRQLADKGWGSPELPENDADALVADESRKTWDLVGSLAGDLAPFNVFHYQNDFHNLKAAIKLAFSGNEEGDQSRYFLAEGNVELEKIQKAAEEHNFGALPDDMARAGREAYQTLAHTGSGQACDMVLDRAALIAIWGASQASGSELLEKYGALTVDSANIKAAVRCSLMNKSREFTERAVAPAGTLNTGKLVDAAMDGLEAIYDLLSHTGYSGAVDALKESPAAFERWCDDEMINMIKPQRHNVFSIEPLAAFILGRENEIRMVRLILSAKINNLSEDALRARLRITYV